MLASIRILLTNNFYGYSPYGSFIPLSFDGRYGALTAYRALLDQDSNSVSDSYLADTAGGTFRLASVTPQGVVGSGGSVSSVVSADAGTIAFGTFARELSGPTVDFMVVMVKDLGSGALVRADTSAAGAGGDAGAGNPSLSGDGRYLSFTSYASNLVPNDSNGASDIFVKDLQTGAIVNASTGLDGALANGASLSSIISSDARVVAFSSVAKNLTETSSPLGYQVFRKDLDKGAVMQVSTTFSGVSANAESHLGGISADGRWVGFESYATNLGAAATPAAQQLYAKDTVTGLLRLVSSSANGAAANGHSLELSLSADGRFAVFSSDASNLVAGDTNGVRDVFLKDLLSGAITRLSTSLAGEQGNEGSMSPSISGDAGTVTFVSRAGNLTKDINGSDDAFIVTVDPAFLATWAGLLLGSESFKGGDSLVGTSGNDLLMGLGGYDQIDGGQGLDTAVLRGLLADFTVVRNEDGSVSTTDSKKLDHTDLLFNIERLHFDNATVALDINGTAGKAYRLYQAAFNRTPDGEGLGFWIAQMDRGASLDSVAASFMQSAEFQAAYGVNPSHAGLVDKFYLNVLHRAGEPDGVAYWLDALDRKLVTPEQVLGFISESAENQAALIGVLQNGFEYIPYP